jgi:hypothetical protein
MGPLFVVLSHPLRSNLARLIQRLERVEVKHLVAEGPIDPFHAGRLIRVGTADYTAMGYRGPYTNSQIDRGKIPGIVEPNRLRLLAPRLESPLQRVTTYLSRLLRLLGPLHSKC